MHHQRQHVIVWINTDSIMRTMGQQIWICNSTVIYEIYDLITDASISFKKKKQQALCSHTLHRYTTICRHKKTHRKTNKWCNINVWSSSFVNVVLNRIYMSQCLWDGLRYTKHKTREKLSYEYISLYLNTYFAFLATVYKTISIYYT